MSYSKESQKVTGSESEEKELAGPARKIQKFQESEIRTEESEEKELEARATGRARIVDLESEGKKLALMERGSMSARLRETQR